MSSNKIIETKVYAAAGGGGLAAAVGEFLLWLLGVLLWHVPADAKHAGDAHAAVPSPVATLLLVLLAVVGAAYGGYKAPHTARPDLNPAATVTSTTGGTTIAATPGTYTVSLGTTSPNSVQPQHETPGDPEPPADPTAPPEADPAA
jgi:hypothetical protein